MRSSYWREWRLLKAEAGKRAALVLASSQPSSDSPSHSIAPSPKSRDARIRASLCRAAQARRLPTSLQAARPAPHPHQTLHPQRQRQGRTLHPDRLANGPMPRPMTLHVNAPPTCRFGCIDTTGTVLMAVSDPCHSSANSPSPGVTC